MENSSAQLLDFKEAIRSRASDQRKPDRETRRLLMYLFTSTKGGFTRLRIIALLLEKQYNTHQISLELGLDYKAVQHHMSVLEKNNMVTKVGEKYGATYRLSNFLEINIFALFEAIEKLERKLNTKKVYL